MDPEQRTPSAFGISPARGEKGSLSKASDKRGYDGVLAASYGGPSSASLVALIQSTGRFH